MKKIYILLFVGLHLITNNLFSQNEFARLINSAEFNNGHGIGQDISKYDNGNIIVSSFGGDTIWHGSVFNYSDSGSLIWSKEIRGVIGGVPLEIKKITDNEFIIAGILGGSYSEELFLLSIDSVGSVNWSFQFGDGTDRNDYFNEMSIDSINKKIYVLYSPRFGGTNLIKFDYSGNIIWVKNFPNVYNSNLCVGKKSLFLFTENQDRFCSKLDTNGNIIWSKSTDDYWYQDIIEKVNSNLVILFNYGAGGNYGIGLLETDSLLNPIRNQSYTKYGSLYPRELIKLDSGGYLVCGHSTEQGTQYGTIYKYDSLLQMNESVIYGDRQSGLMDLVVHNDFMYLVGYQYLGYNNAFDVFFLSLKHSDSLSCGTYINDYKDSILSVNYSNYIISQIDTTVVVSNDTMYLLPINYFEKSFCFPVYGCTDTNSTNYSSLANIDDGSCFLLGCTDSTSDNYDSLATIDDGSCYIAGCTNPQATNYNPSATLDDSSCVLSVEENLKNLTYIYPNPIIEEFIVDIGKLKQKVNFIALLDLRGSLVYSSNTIKERIHTVNVSEVHSGLYILVVYTDKGVYREQVVVR